jgi:hypothetical protein
LPTEIILKEDSLPMFWILLELVVNSSPSILSSSVVRLRGACVVKVVVSGIGHLLLDSQKNEQIDDVERGLTYEGVQRYF